MNNPAGLETAGSRTALVLLSVLCHRLLAGESVSVSGPSAAQASESLASAARMTEVAPGMWSAAIRLPRDDFPLRYRYVLNGARARS